MYWTASSICIACVPWYMVSRKRKSERNLGRQFQGGAVRNVRSKRSTKLGMLSEGDKEFLILRLHILKQSFHCRAHLVDFVLHAAAQIDRVQ